MLIWIVFAIITGLCVLALLWPLSRSHAASRPVTDARALYEAQIAEIGRDVERGLTSAEDAEIARAEAARRLIRAARDEAVEAAAVDEGLLRRRRAASALALSIVPLVALTFYGAYGSPHLPSQPLSSRLSTDPARMDIAVAVARIENHLQLNPGDGRGWELLAPIYMRAGRYDDAATAYANAARHLGPSVERLVDLAEARALAAAGVVTAEARAAIDDAARLGPLTPKGRYYLAVAREQDGDVAGAAADFEALLASAPPGANWTGMVTERLARLKAVPDGGAEIAALPPEERNAAVRAMVDGLAGRLAAQGGSPEDWQRLVRARTVLGQRAEAERSLAEARAALSGDAGALAALDALARETGLEPRP